MKECYTFRLFRGVLGLLEGSQKEMNRDEPRRVSYGAVLGMIKCPMGRSWSRPQRTVRRCCREKNRKLRSVVRRKEEFFLEAVKMMDIGSGSSHGGL